MWVFQAFKDLHSSVKGWFGNRDVCLGGAPLEKSTCFMPMIKQSLPSLVLATALVILCILLWLVNVKGLVKT